MTEIPSFAFRVSSFAVALCFVLLSGCGGKKDAAAKDPGIERKTDRGPHSVVVRVDRQKPTVAEPVNLELAVSAAEDWKVVWPVVKGKLGEFQVVDQGESRPELLPDGRTRQVRNYVLEPFLSGAYSIPPLEFKFEKEGQESQRLETEELKLEVLSLLKEGTKDIHDIAAPVALREKWGLAWLWWLLGLAALAGAGGWWWWHRRRLELKAAAIPPRPAHEIAFEELDALQALNLPGQGEIKRYYQELSLILRRYVENRFGVHAPGQTTEEFLVYQSRSGILESRHQVLLREFLLHCDLVKFAELEAGPDQAQKAMEVCRNFVSETRLIVDEATPAQATQLAVETA